MAASLALAEDEAGTGWALLSLTAGIGGAFAASELAARRARADQRKEQEQETVSVPFERTEPAPAEQTQPA
jgi:hypothetical protein